MQKATFNFMGQRIALWTHPEPDHLARVIRSTGTFYEPDVLMKCREIYLPGTSVVDVGANIGNHAVFFAAILGARVHAFEPFEANHALLELNIAENALEGSVLAYRLALGDRSGFGTARTERADNLGAVSVRPGGGEVRIDCLDRVPVDGPIGLLKIDVEGAEAAVLRGGAGTIARWLPDIVLEADGPARFQEAAEILHELGYAPRGRYAWTPTYLFSALDQRSRVARYLEAVQAPRSRSAASTAAAYA